MPSSRLSEFVWPPGRNVHPAKAARAHIPGSAYFSSLRAITMRWTWLVPS